MKGCIQSYTTIYTTQLYPSQLVTDIKCVRRDISTNSGSAFVPRADSPFEILKHWFSQLHHSLKGFIHLALHSHSLKPKPTSIVTQMMHFTSSKKFQDTETCRQCLFLEESRHLQHSININNASAADNAINKDSHKPNMC